MSPPAALVWKAWLDVDRAQPAPYRALLSSDELSRAMRYRKDADRDRYVVRRAVLRIVLGRVLGIPQHLLRFGYGPSGKPYIDRPAAGRALRSSVSHADGLAVFGCAFGRDVGVDVERVCVHPDLLAVAESCFSTREQAELRTLPHTSQARAFYRCWTRKEAYVKAIGSGLRASLRDFEVSLDTDKPASLLRVGWSESEPARWRMEELDVPFGYIGAVVAERPKGERV
jgi:4'-phosphopantetheinyl transferase